MPVSLKIDDKEYQISDEIFRQILKSARFNLSRLQKEEGKEFPKNDKRTLDFITTIQTNHTKFI